MFNFSSKYIQSYLVNWNSRGIENTFQISGVLIIIFKWSACEQCCFRRRMSTDLAHECRVLGHLFTRIVNEELLRAVVPPRLNQHLLELAYQLNVSCRLGLARFAVGSLGLRVLRCGLLRARSLNNRSQINRSPTRRRSSGRCAASDHGRRRGMSELTGVGIAGVFRAFELSVFELTRFDCICIRLSTFTPSLKRRVMNQR